MTLEPFTHTENRDQAPVRLPVSEPATLGGDVDGRVADVEPRREVPAAAKRAD
jgi:hypothetical protein